MSVTSKAEQTLLSHDELQVVTASHHPAIYEMDKAGLRSLQKQLRAERRQGSRRCLASYIVKCVEKPSPEAKAFPATAESQPLKRKRDLRARFEAGEPRALSHRKTGSENRAHRSGPPRLVQVEMSGEFHLSAFGQNCRLRHAAAPEFQAKAGSAAEKQSRERAQGQ